MPVRGLGGCLPRPAGHRAAAARAAGCGEGGGRGGRGQAALRVVGLQGVGCKTGGVRLRVRVGFSPHWGPPNQTSPMPPPTARPLCSLARPFLRPATRRPGLDEALCPISRVAHLGPQNPLTPRNHRLIHPLLCAPGDQGGGGRHWHVAHPTCTPPVVSGPPHERLILDPTASSTRLCPCRRPGGGWPTSDRGTSTTRAIISPSCHLAPAV